MSDLLATTADVRTALGWTMLHMLWVGALLGVAAAAGRALLRAARPETRYGFALACLLGLAVAPAPVFWRVCDRRPDAPAVALRPAAVRGQGLPLAGKAEAIEPVVRRVVPLAVADRHGTRRGDRLEAVVVALAWLWMAGSALTLALVGTGLVGVERLRRSSRRLETGEVAARCRALADSLGIARRVGLGICDRIAAPVLIGIVRPMILLPPAALCGWSVEQLEMVLLHELAHLRRWDNLVNLAQRLVESLLFFHPVAWWLSGWVRLERELGCDRLVVARTGRATAYAEMLVALAGSSHEGSRIALAMADGQVLTRVRRILNLEDRSMRLTMPEGIGLLAAAVAGLVLALGVHAAPPGKPPAPQAQDANPDRQALRKAAEDVNTMRSKTPFQEAMRSGTLVIIAEAQVKLGDRNAARSTLRSAFESIGRVDPNGINDDAGSAEALTFLPELARVQRLAGDTAGARETLTRMLGLIDAIRVDPAESSKVAPIDGGLDRVDHFSGNVLQAELLAVVADAWLAQGDRDQARVLARRAVVAARAEQGPLKPMLAGPLGEILFKCGDAGGARAAIDEGRVAAMGLEPRYRQKSLAQLAWALGRIGDREGAIALARSQADETARLHAFRKLIESLTHDEPTVWFKPSGLKISIGAEGVGLEDRAAARRDLPALAKAVRAAFGPLNQARTLATIAHLQAKAGDFAGALETAGSIPALRRADFPRPSDGFYDAVRPATLALVAGLQAKAGDAASARDGLRRSATLGRAVANAGEKVVALIVIAREQAKAGETAEARALLDEAVALARDLPEPRRSRSLAELAAVQIVAGDVPGATRTAEAVRNAPGLEKLMALDALADWHEKAGDAEAARGLLRQSLACLEANDRAKPAAPKGPYLPGTYTARLFMDPDLELDPATFPFFLGDRSITLRARLGDRDGAVRAARALPAGVRDAALGNLVRELASLGDAAGALALAATLESVDQRLSAVAQAVGAVGERTALK